MAEVPKFVPLSEIDRITPPPRVSFAENLLPDYIDRQRLGVNLRGANRLCRIGSIRNLRVVAGSGETSTYTPDIVGMDGHGNAFAGLKATKKEVPTYSTQTDSHGKRGVDVTVEINVAEIMDRITGGKKPGNLRSPEEWSKHLDKSLTEGVREAGFRYLMLDVPKIGYLAEATEQLIFLSDPSVKRFLASFGFFFVASVGHEIGKEIQDHRNGGRQHNSSHLHPYPAHAAALGIAGRSTTLIKALPEQAK